MRSVSRELLNVCSQLLRSLLLPTPFSLPRLLQFLSAIHFIFIWVIVPIMSTWLPFYIFLCTPFWWTIPLYLAWFVYDWNSPSRGSRPWKWYKSHSIWKYFAEYFPLRLVKTAELPPNKNYIICSHPHGVLSIAAFIHMLTDATGFSEKFPGLSSTIMTLSGQFYFPFRREVGIFLGGVECSGRSLDHLLSHPGKGRAVTIVVGGATESLDAHPGSLELNLMSRRGFCKYALKYGAPLVPMFNFGENDLFEQVHNPKGSHLRNFQQRIKSVLGFCPPLLKGCGVFSWSFGILPFKRPVTSVVGKPISVERVENPTPEQIDNLHSAYCDALIELFEQHKSSYGIPAHAHLNIY